MEKLGEASIFTRVTDAHILTFKKLCNFANCSQQRGTEKYVQDIMLLSKLTFKKQQRQKDYLIHNSVHSIPLNIQVYPNYASLFCIFSYICSYKS